MWYQLHLGDILNSSGDLKLNNDLSNDNNYKEVLSYTTQFYLLLFEGFHHFEQYNVMTDSECTHALIN